MISEIIVEPERLDSNAFDAANTRRRPAAISGAPGSATTLGTEGVELGIFLAGNKQTSGIGRLRSKSHAVEAEELSPE